LQHLLQALPRPYASCAARCQRQAGRGQGPGAVRRALPRVTRGCCCAGRHAAAVGCRRAAGAGGWRCGGRRQPRRRHPGAAVERRHAAVPAHGAGRGAAGHAAYPGTLGVRARHNKRRVSRAAGEAVTGAGSAATLSARAAATVQQLRSTALAQSLLPPRHSRAWPPGALAAMVSAAHDWGGTRR